MPVLQTSAVGTSATTSVSTTLPSLTNGNTLIAIIATANTHSTTAMTGSGQNWQEIYANGSLSFWGTSNYTTMSSTVTLTATVSASGTSYIQVLEVSNLSLLLDVAGSANFATSNTASTNALAPSSTGTLLIAAIQDFTSTFSGSASSGWNPLFADADDVVGGWMIGTQNVSETLTWSLTSSAAWVARSIGLFPTRGQFGGNLLIGDSATFEGGTLGQWLDINSGATVTNSTDQAHSGTNSIKIVTGATTNSGPYTTQIPATPGATYTISSWIYASTENGTVGPGISFYAGQNIISEAGNPSSISTGSWQYFTYTVVAPANTDNMRAFMYPTVASSPATFYMDDCCLMANSGSVIGPGTISVARSSSW